MSDVTADEPATDAPAADELGHPADEYGVLFWVGTVVGWAIIAYGAWLLYDDPEASWFNTARLAIIGIIAHDVVWLSVSGGCAWLAARIVGRRVPHWIRWATWTSAIVIAMWLPLWRGYGDRLRNDTILPRNYTVSILVLLPLIWALAAGYEAVRRRRQRAAEPDSPGFDSPGLDSAG